MQDPSMFTMKRAMLGAAVSGHLDMVKHLHSRGVPLTCTLAGSSVRQLHMDQTSSVDTLAARHLRLPVLEFLHHNQAITFDVDLLQHRVEGMRSLSSFEQYNVLRFLLRTRDGVGNLVI